MSRLQLALVIAVIACFGAACGDTSGPTGSGDLRLSVAANEAVRVGFPHEENGDMLEFVEGWTVTLDTFAVSMERVELREASEEGDGPLVASFAEPYVADIAASADGETEYTTLIDVSEGRHDLVYRVAPVSADGSADIDPETLGQMRDNGWSVVLRGTATPPADHPEFSSTVSFDLGFDLDAEYYDCVNGADGTKGVVVAANRENEAYIYPHLVHIFWDSLGAGNEQLRFDAFARAAGDDAVVNLEELDTVDLTDPALADENGVPLYDDAGLLDTYTLGAFVRRAMVESFHFNGIGFCKKRFTR
jgi:hypothetical protein